MRLNEWITWWESVCPVSWQDDWDNSGLQIGEGKAPIERIFLSLDFTPQVLKRAIQVPNSLIFTHHPVFFNDCKSITDETLPGEMILSAIRHGVAVYASHTPLDKWEHGVNAVLANTLSLKDVRPLEEEADNPGIGRLARLDGEMGLEQFAYYAEDACCAQGGVYYGAKDKPIKTVAVVGGSGASFWKAAQKKGADVLVTGDVKHHDALDAVMAGFSIVDLGHYGTERGVLDYLQQFFTEHNPQCSCEVVEQDVYGNRHIVRNML